jgi:hypothetical protein
VIQKVVGILTLPSQNDTLATLKDVELLGSPWTFKGTTSVTGPAPAGAVQGDAWINKTAGQPDSSWLGLAPNKVNTLRCNACI